jgi:hypothetical protein
MTLPENHPIRKPEAQSTAPNAEPSAPTPPEQSKEFGGRKGPEPTRYGDWEVKGKAVDF